MIQKGSKKIGRDKRHRRIRRKVSGTASRPRLSVSKSLKHICAQLINDDNGQSLLLVSSLSPECREKLKNGGNVQAAKAVGEQVAIKAKKLGIEKVVFDRGGNLYHGRIQALAEAARGAGLSF